MLNPGPGEIAALLTALSWTATMLAFEAAGKRIGSLNVNFLRVAIAAVFLSVFGYLHRGLWWPGVERGRCGSRASLRRRGSGGLR